jgi:hypothetical protein
MYHYKTNRGNFSIEIIEKGKPIKRNAYDYFRVKFSVRIENDFDNDWKIEITDPWGYIDDIKDKEALINKLFEEIKIRLDTDEPGQFNISDSKLDLRKDKQKY